jgi:methyltransferase (TIGR00027 family)
MKTGRFSETALGATYVRSIHYKNDRPLIFEDPYAPRLLDSDDRRRLDEHARVFLSEAQQAEADAIEDDDRRRAYLVRALPFAGTQLVTYRYAEECLQEAIDAGVSQYVLLGAGLDSFSLRYRNEGADIRVFEIDHPDTQAMKKERLAALGLEPVVATSYVPVDFESESFPERLLSSGYSSHGRSFFSWLNVTMFLSREAVRSTLESMVSLASSGSQVIFDFYGDDVGTDPSDRGEVARVFQVTEIVGEPMFPGFAPDELKNILRSIGYARAEIIAPRHVTPWNELANEHGLRFMSSYHVARAWV